MYRSIYFKIVAIFFAFMIAVMTVVGAILVNGVFRFYSGEFYKKMDALFSEGSELRADLSGALSSADFAEKQKEILLAYGSSVGLDAQRNFFVCDMNGNVLSSSSSETTTVAKTPNLISAMSGETGKEFRFASGYADYALPITVGDAACIVYLYDTQEETEALCWEIFTIILQALLVGLILSALLSFILSRTITSPIRNITRGVRRVAKGDFTLPLKTYSKDEIGLLTDSFNEMSDTLNRTLKDVSGEREKLETVFSYLQDGVLAFAEDGSILNSNKSASALLGSAFRDGLTCGELLELLALDSEKSSGVRERNKDANSERKTFRDVSFRTKALDIDIGPFRYPENNTLKEGTLVVLHDVTSRYELDKSQKEFVANVSHELRTPLTSIKGATETLLEYPDLEAPMRDNFLKMAAEECDRMLRLVTDLLTLSRLDNNKTRWKIVSFDMRQALLHVCKVMQVEASEHGHSLSLHMPDSISPMTGDLERLEQVLINIVSNAVKYTPYGGEIKINARESDGFVSISVSDNGAGIPKEDIPRLFERFYRVEKARNTEAGGTGLGLAIVKEIVNAHGGTVRVESELGKGTTVTVLLPVKTTLK